jgi:hypothetical protein
VSVELVVAGAFAGAAGGCDGAVWAAAVTAALSTKTPAARATLIGYTSS